MKKSIVFAIVIIAVVAAFFIVDTLFFQKKVEPTIPKTIYEKDATVKEQAAETQGKTEEVIAGKIKKVEKERDFDAIKLELIEICRELDTKDYIKAYDLKQGTFNKFSEVLEKLAYNPPVVSGETNDLYTLLSNAAHFYRRASKEDIGLVKDILDHEHDRIEILMAVVYDYLVTGSRERRLMINIGQLYEYAGFFLNTLGGKAYLYRRDYATRTLTQYYSVLILDQANKEKMNPYGIDIMPHVRLLRQELEGYRGLVGADSYLAVLQGIEASTQR
ncbi:MAG TPA: hypothetical protein ENN05_12555 [Deltaproteobacteria bacterium]|nr:hypothetical protein [Deltaproteobacteria bacterium]